MSDLISRKAFKQQLSAMAIKENLDIEKVSAMLKLIDMQPTAYDVDKVEEELVKKAISEDEVLYVNGDEFTYFLRLDDVKEILKGGLEE